MHTYPSLCTGCYRYWYEEDGEPCPICFPGLERPAADIRSPRGEEETHEHDRLGRVDLERPER